MDCKTSEKYMPGFLDKTLSYDELRLFINHIKVCPNCMEELGTSYLLDVALKRIEDGQTVNLNSELDQRIIYAEKANVLHYFFSNIFRSIEVIAGIFLALSAARVLVTYVVPYIRF